MGRRLEEALSRPGAVAAAREHVEFTLVSCDTCVARRACSSTHAGHSQGVPATAVCRLARQQTLTLAASSGVLGSGCSMCARPAQPACAQHSVFAIEMTRQTGWQ